MARFTLKQYQRHVMVAMSFYMAFMLLAWPMVSTPIGMPLKVLLAILAVAPVLYVSLMLARRIRDSDEFEQRMHLIALGVASLTVVSLSLIGGFLAAAHVLTIDGSVLIWVWPVMLLTYGITRALVSRRYGANATCEDESRFPVYLRLLLIGVVLLAIVALDFHALGDDRAGLLTGLGTTLSLGGIVLGIRRWRARHSQHGEHV